MAENDFLIDVMGYGETKPLLHIPGKYKTDRNHVSFKLKIGSTLAMCLRTWNWDFLNFKTFSKTSWLKEESSEEIITVSMEEIAAPYKGISRYLIEQIYLNYFP